MLIGTLALVIVAFALGWWVWPWLAVLVLPVLVWLFAFFRDPERPIPGEQYLYVSPADGTVSDIETLEQYELLGGPAVRVGIFLSVFNVHINRSPCDGRIVDAIYQKGKFINAMRHNEASTQNESNTIVLAETNGQRRIAVVKQIVGLIARRIVFASKTGDVLRRGQRIGMIKFGSRTELYIPTFLEPEIRVQVGQKVRGGADVIAVLKRPIETTQPARQSPERKPLVGRQTPA